MNEAITQAITVFGNNLKSKHLIAFSGTVIFSLFWFCAIYLIAPNFYQSSPIFISIIISFLFGLIWFFLNLIISILMTDCVIVDLSNDNNQSIVLVDALVYSVAFFAPLLWFCYYNMDNLIPCTQIRPSFFLFTNTTFIWAIARFCFAYRKFKTTVKNATDNPENV